MGKMEPLAAAVDAPLKMDLSSKKKKCTKKYL